MKVTSIEQQKRNENRVNIYCDGEYKFAMSKNGLVDFFVYVGKELTQEDIDDIVQKDSVNKGKNIALNYLGYGMKSEKEVRDKLKKNEIANEYIDIIITQLKDYGYINDSYYVDCYIRERAIPSKWGKSKIISNLYQKGINKELILERLELCEEYNETKDDSVEKLIRKKLSSLSKEEDIRKKKNKVFTFMMSKGYSYDEFSDIANRIFDEIDDE